MDTNIRLHNGEPRDKSKLELIGSVAVSGKADSGLEDTRFFAFMDANNQIRDDAKKMNGSDVYGLKYFFVQEVGSHFCFCNAEGLLYKRL